MDEVDNDPVERYEKILTANLQRTIDFLKFGEAKNAALLALSSAWVLAAINLGCSGKLAPGIWPLCMILAGLFSLCAALLAAASFLPKLKLEWFLGGKKAGPHPRNLLFFGDISALTVKALETEIHARYFPESGAFRSEYIHDLIVQISVNSHITMRKMKLFFWGMRFILTAGFALLVPLIGLVIQNLRGLL